MREESGVLLLLLEMEWVMCKEQPQGAKRDPRLTDNKEMKTSVPQV